MSQESVELLRPAYAALSRGDVDAVLQVCDPTSRASFRRVGSTPGPFAAIK